MVGYILSKHNAAKSGAVILFLISKVLQMEARGNGMVACRTTRWRYVWTKKVFIPVPKGMFSFFGICVHFLCVYLSLVSVCAYVLSFSYLISVCMCMCVCTLVSVLSVCVCLHTRTCPQAQSKVSHWTWSVPMPASLVGQLALGMLSVPPEFTGGHHPTSLWVLAVHIFHTCRRALEPSPKPTSLHSLRVNGR